MAFFDFLKGRGANRAENPLYPVTPEIIKGSISRSVDVSPSRGALRLSPVIAAERFITESIANLPLITYKNDHLGGKERAKELLEYELLKDFPNEFMTSFDFWSRILKDMIRSGNAFVYIERNLAGQIINLLPLRPETIKVKYNGTKVFIYRVIGEKEYEIPASQLLHFKSNSDDGLIGKALLIDSEQTLELMALAEAYAVDFFKNGTTTPEHIEMATPPTKEQAEQIKQFLKTWKDDRHGIKLVPGGKLVRTGYDEGNQYIELRKFQLLEVARIFRIPPQLLQHYENGGTYANIEAQQIDLVVNSLQSWISIIEKEINMKLFRGTDYVAEFLIDARLRGDTGSRYSAYSTALAAGFLTKDEVRAKENLPSLPEIEQPPVEGDNQNEQNDN